MISEVIEYEEAELVFKWDKAIETGLQVQIPQLMKLGSDNKWTDDATLVVKFKPRHLVGYKAVEIGKAYKRLIGDRIKYRQNNGEDKCMYIDKDGDGFGDASSEPTIIPSAKSSQYKNYVDNNLDCYDMNKEVFPGQSKFFAQQRGDGKFDYNCDAVEQKETESIGLCKDCRVSPQGWQNTIPKCGERQSWLKDCDLKPLKGGCIKETEDRFCNCN